MNQLQFYFTLLITLLISMQAFGQANYALEFDGIDDHVNLGSFAGNGILSAEFWFKPDQNYSQALGTRATFMYRNNNTQFEEWGIYIGQSSLPAEAGRIVFLRQIGSNFHQVVSDTTLWQFGRWYHVAATIDPIQGMQLYIDGLLQSSTDPTTVPTPSSNFPLTIGRWGNANIRYFDGRMDEVRVWNRVLSQSEIIANMCDTLIPGNQIGMVGYWRFDEGTDTIANDLSANANAGIINGATFVEETTCIKTSETPVAFAGELSVYPNPFSEMVTLDLGREPVGEIRLKVFNSKGMEVKRIERLRARELILDGSGLRSGFYYYRLEEKGTHPKQGTIILE